MERDDKLMLMKILGVFYGKSARTYLWVTLVTILLVYCGMNVMHFSTLLVSVDSVTRIDLFEFIRYIIFMILGVAIINPQSELCYAYRADYHEVKRLSKLLDKYDIIEKAENLSFINHRDMDLRDLDIDDYKLDSNCCIIFIILQAVSLSFIFVFLNMYGLMGFTDVPLLLISLTFVGLLLFIVWYNRKVLHSLLETEKMSLLWEIEARFFLEYFGISSDENPDADIVDSLEDDDDDDDFDF